MPKAPKKTPEEKVKEIIQIRAGMQSIKTLVSSKWQQWVDAVEGYEGKDEQGQPIYNNKIEAQFLDTFISKFTGSPELELIPEGKEDRAKVDTIKALFANTWHNGRMTHKQQLHLKQSGELGLSLVHIGVDSVNDLIKNEIVTGVDEKGEEIIEEIEVRDKRDVVFMEVVDMREVFTWDYPEWDMCTELIRDTWVDVSEWSSKYENNKLFNNLDQCKPVIRDLNNGTFRYPKEGQEAKARWYKVTKFFKEPDGDKGGDRYEIIVNDKTMIYEGPMPNRSFEDKKKRLPFSLLAHKRRGFGFLQSKGIPEQLEQPAKAYNRALHQYRIAAAMSSIGFMTLEGGATLKNEKDKIFTGAIMEIEGDGRTTWNKAPAPGGELLQVANDTYENMVRIMGFDPRSSVVAQKVTTAFQRAAEEKAQDLRLAQYKAEIEVDMQRQGELIVAAIIQSAVQVDVEATLKNMKLKKGHKDRFKTVYKKVTLKDAEPIKQDGKTIGVREKKGASNLTVEITPEMINFKGIINVKTPTSRPLYELSDRQIENEYVANTLVPLIEAAPLLDQKGFDSEALIEQSMEKNNISLPKKSMSKEEKIGEVAAKYSPASGNLKTIMQMNEVSNAATQGVQAGQTPQPQAGGVPGTPEALGQ